MRLDVVLVGTIALRVIAAALSNREKRNMMLARVYDGLLQSQLWTNLLASCVWTPVLVTAVRFPRSSSSAFRS